MSLGNGAAGLQLARNEADGRGGGRWWQSAERRRVDGKLQDEQNKVQRTGGGRGS
jgi:hypothetical protein